MPSPSEASTSRSSSPASDTSAPPPPDAEEASIAHTPATENVTFKSLGVIDPLLEALGQMKFTKPTEIQAQAIPYALEGRDIIGVAETVGGHFNRLMKKIRRWLTFCGTGNVGLG